MEGERQTVLGFITNEINNYQTLPIKVSENYEWSMFDHIKLTTLYKNSQFDTGKSDDKPFKNIIKPILNLQYRAEGFDVKDIILYVNERKNHYKSFLIRKYHEKWTRETGMDEFIDDMVENYVDFGGALSKKLKGRIPEIVPWQTIAFCDQTDIISGPVCIKHSLSPDQLKDMEELGWGDEKNGAEISIDDLIELSKSYRTTDKTKEKITTPGRYIEIYELHGVLPDYWLSKNGYEGEWGKFTRQLQVVAYYQKEDGKKEGFCLFKGKEKSPFKFIARDKIFGRALGCGGAEELFEAQVWTNYDIIRMKDMLDAAAKILFQTTDPAFAKRNKLKSLDNMEILTVAEGRRIDQINTTPANITLFERSVNEWEANARITGAATESIMGEQPNSGTPFKLQELVTSEAHSLHEYRKGKLAAHLDDIYRDWIIPDLVAKINEGDEFLAELDADEMDEIVDNVVVNEANKINKEKVLRGQIITPEEREMTKQEIRAGFLKSNKKFINILKGELKDAPVDVKTNIAGKQKYLSAMTDKIVNVLRFALSTYNAQTGKFAAFEDKRMLKLFQNIMESSGLDPLGFSDMGESQPIQNSPSMTATRPLENITAARPKENLAAMIK